MGRNGKKGNRKPASRHGAGPPAKRPSTDPSVSAEQFRDHPVFSFLWADARGEAPCLFDPGPDAQELVSFLCEMNRLTWNEIRAQMAGGHKKHHDHPIDRLNARVRTALSRRPDLEEILDSDLFRFRLSGRKRLWGFVQEQTFYVLWWDPLHRVYPTERG